MIRVPAQQSLLSDDQIECIIDFAAGVAGERSSLREIQYNIVGTADLAQGDEARALLRSLESEDWQDAASHQEIAGVNNLLMAILLHIELAILHSQDYWVAVRSPFEYLESASVIACGRIASLPKVQMSVLSLNAAERKA